MTSFKPEDLDDAPCGFIIFSDDGTVEAVNNTLADLLGYGQKNDLVANNINILLSPAGNIFFQTHLFPMLRLSGEAHEIFVSLRSKNSETVPVICNITRKRIDAVYQNHGVLFPVKQRQKYEEELLSARRKAEDALDKNTELLIIKKELEDQSIELDRKLSRLTNINKDLVQFTKLASHDLQEPIRKIAMRADKIAVQNNTLLSKDILHSLERIHSDARKSRELLTELHKFMTLNQVNDHLKSTDLNVVVPVAFKNAFAGKSPGDIELEIRELPAIDAFQEQIQLLFFYIFQLLIESSVQPIHLSFESSIVQKNSFQIKKEKYNYINLLKIVLKCRECAIFWEKGNPFQIGKLANGTNMDLDFRLAFCKKIVDNHYGTIEIFSENDQNAVFILLLPISQ